MSMKIAPLTVEGAFLIESLPAADNRGYFSRVFCEDTFKKYGLETHFPQSSISFNKKRGTTRGLHYQANPRWEIKIVRVIVGRVYDVIVDLRPYSVTFKKHVAVKLDAAKHNAVYIPAGCAHGFQTLTEGATLLYYCSENFQSDLARGYRYNDPAFGIKWPVAKGITISEKDLELPLWDS